MIIFLNKQNIIIIHLYSQDARLDKIEKCNLDGSNRVVVARNNPKHAFSLAIYGDYVVWTDWVRLSVMRANKYTGENVEQLRKEIPKPMALIAVAPQDLVCETNPVLCPEGKFMNNDGQCTIKPSFKGKEFLLIF
jgi:low-density lipoprotein receptor-related protein 1 (alpha-2-macroglobulin receptor)